MEDKIKQYLTDNYNLENISVQYTQDDLVYYIKVDDKRLLNGFTFTIKWDYLIPVQQNLNIVDQKLCIGILGDFKI